MFLSPQRAVALLLELSPNQSAVMMLRRNILRSGLALALLAIQASGGALAADPPDRSAAQLMDVVMWNREPVGGPFLLTDYSGKVRRDTDFRGKLMLVYFGYTTCPDICPTDLLQIGLAMKQLGSDAAGVAPIFITLDPERDTRKLLGHYVPAFHSQIVGLTGNSEAIRKAALAYKVYYKKVPIGGWLRYTIDHSAFIYLMGRDGKYIGFLPPSTSAERIVEMIRPHLLTTSR